MTGNLLGASASGVIGDLLGWAVCSPCRYPRGRGVGRGDDGFRGAALTRAPAKMDLGMLRHGYRTIFANPNALVCFGAVFVEGCCVLGLFPYLAAFLFELGETSLAIAGIVIAGFASGACSTP